MEFKQLKPSELLPHKAPMLLIDKVLYTDFDKIIRVQTTVKGDAFFFQGHFPNYPILPGVVIIEMMFQTCGILNRVTSNNIFEKNKIIKLGKAVKIKSATFFKEVFPDSVLIIEAKKIRNIFSFSEYEVHASVKNQKVCTAELTLNIKRHEK